VFYKILEIFDLMHMVAVVKNLMCSAIYLAPGNFIYFKLPDRCRTVNLQIIWRSIGCFWI